MNIIKLYEAPSLDSFTSLAEHQSQTPSSFYSAKPVLYYHEIDAKALLSKDNNAELPLFESSEHLEMVVSVASFEAIEVFVNSDNLTLFNRSNSKGVNIPYTTITLHAIQSICDPADPSQKLQGLYMQIEIAANQTQDESTQFILTIIPKPSISLSQPSINALFEAVSTCSNLHPDQSMEDDEPNIGNMSFLSVGDTPAFSAGQIDSGLPPAFPGSGGWITSENVSEFFDEEGNFKAENKINASTNCNQDNDMNSFMSLNGRYSYDPLANLCQESDTDPITVLGEGAGRIHTRDENDLDSEENKRAKKD